MYIPGTLVYFIPFYFQNGSSKNKYFLVLANAENNVIVASLPTSKDHIPNSIIKTHGCISDENMRINCYFFQKNKIISECGAFGFPENTYLYGEQIDFFSLKKLQSTYKDKDYIIKCKLSNVEFKAIKECLKKSSVVKRKIKRHL